MRLFLFWLARSVSVYILPFVLMMRLVSFLLRLNEEGLHAVLASALGLPPG